MATASRASGTRLRLYARYRLELCARPLRAEQLGVGLVDRDDIFRRADIVSVHLRNTPEVRGLVGARELALMQPSAYLINTARGALVDQDALEKALRGGRLAGAGLDVFVEGAGGWTKSFGSRECDPHYAVPPTREANAALHALPVANNIIAYLESPTTSSSL